MNPLESRFVNQLTYLALQHRADVTCRRSSDQITQEVIK